MTAVNNTRPRHTIKVSNCSNNVPISASGLAPNRTRCLSYRLSIARRRPPKKRAPASAGDGPSRPPPRDPPLPRGPRAASGPSTPHSTRLAILHNHNLAERCPCSAGESPADLYALARGLDGGDTRPAPARAVCGGLPQCTTRAPTLLSLPENARSTVI